jgi:hypothetical protein
MTGTIQTAFSKLTGCTVTFTKLQRAWLYFLISKKKMALIGAPKKEKLRSGSIISDNLPKIGVLN